MNFPLYTIALAIAAAALFIVCLAITYGPRLTATWKAATNPGRTVFLFAVLILCAYAGTKPPTLGGAAPSRATFTSGEDAASPFVGYRFKGVTTNDAPNYARPAGAVRNERWFAHGAYEAWCRIDLSPFVFPMGDDKIGSFSVFTDGKMRPTPRDAERELGAGTKPMLCLQGSSELWYGATASGGRVVTWKDFHPDADTNRAVSIQVELFPSVSHAHSKWLPGHLLFRIILQYAAVSQPRVLFLFRGTRNILPTPLGSIPVIPSYRSVLSGDPLNRRKSTSIFIISGVSVTPKGPSSTRPA